MKFQTIAQGEQFTLVTPDAVPVNTILMNLDVATAVCLFQILLMCRNPATNQAKCWNFTSVIKNLAGVPTLASTVGGSAFGLPADLTALAGATVAFFVQGSQIGLTLTGLAATELDWGWFINSGWEIQS